MIRATSSLVLTCVVLLALPMSLLANSAEDVGSIVRSSQSGRWSAPATWEGGRLPDTGSKVHIQNGHTVTYDIESDDVIRSIHVAGVLTFAHDVDTTLNVGLIYIASGNGFDEAAFDLDHAHHGKASHAGHGSVALLVGTQQQPIDADVRALIRLHYLPGLDEKDYPAIVCAGERMEFHGAPMSRTWVKLGDTASEGSTEVILAETVTGWRKGDRVVLTGSFGNFSGMRPQTEVRRIAAVDGSALRLDRPLEFMHRGVGEFRAEIANLSRNVVVESADPEGVRGHTMYHRDSTGSVSYAEFRHLGKRGVLARYPLHFHLCRDSMRGSSVVGASIWDSDNRWIAVHGTEYLVLRDCVGYKSVGHGYFLEDGTEAYNILDRNLAIGATNGQPLPGQTLPFDKNDGAGFWWSNSLNTFTRNVAADCEGYGFRYEATPRAGFKEDDHVYGSPDERFDLNLPVLHPDGTRQAVDIRTLPFVRFEDNTAHNIANYALNLGQDAGEVGPDRDRPFVIRGMKIWNAQRGYTTHVPNVLIDGMQIRRCGYEIYRARYTAQDYRNVELSQIQGKYTVSDLDSYLATGVAADKPGVGLNRSRLPGFPRGTGAGGTSYQGAEVEVATLQPVDDMPPMTVITGVRIDGDQMHLHGISSDNGTLQRVMVNGQQAELLDQYGNWQITIRTSQGEDAVGVVSFAAHAADAAGNEEHAKHVIKMPAQDD